MAQDTVQPTPHAQEEPGATGAPSPDKMPWQEPKLTFVEPTLTTHGELTEVTGGFFGTFTP